jgi:hypothetical protein
LGSLPSIHLKTLYANYVLMTIYREATKVKTNGMRTIVVAEEAQNYIPSRRPGELPTIAERIVYELRSFGVGVVLVCPDSELLPAPVLKDVGAVVAMGPDSLPRFALERYLFRASLEEAEKTLKELKKAKMVVYHKGNLHFFRRLRKPPKELKLKARPKPAPKVVEVKEAEEKVAEKKTKGEKPKVVEVVEMKVEEKPKVVEEFEPKGVEVKPLRLEEEELEEIEEPEAIELEVEKRSETAEPIEKERVEGPVVEVEEAKIAEEEEEAEMVEEEIPMTVEPEPTPRAELRLEEEVKEEPKEEAEGVEAIGKGVSEAPSSQEGWELFGHLLVEDLQVRGRTSVMKCVRCGASAPLTGLKALKEIPCTPKEVVRAEKPTKKCENCGREATASLCDECADAFEKG